MNDRKLDKWTLESEIAGLARYLNYTKNPSKDTIEAWHSKLKRFTDEHIHKAVDKMKDDLDMMPKNFPKIAKQYINIIFKAEFEKNKYKWINYGYCQGCGGMGGFQLFEKHPFMKNRSLKQQWTTVIAFCSDCENWRNWTGINGFDECNVSSTELDRRGIIYVNIKQPMTGWRRLTGKVPQPGLQTGKTTDDVEKLAADIAKPI